MCMGQLVKLASDTPLLEAIQRRYPGYHPVLAMVELSFRNDVYEKDPKLEFEIHKAVAPYIVPRLSSLEVTPPKAPSQVIVSLFEDLQLENGDTVQVEIPLVRDIDEIHEIVRLD